MFAVRIQFCTVVRTIAVEQRRDVLGACVASSPLEVASNRFEADVMAALVSVDGALHRSARSCRGSGLRSSVRPWAISSESSSTIWRSTPVSTAVHRFDQTWSRFTGGAQQRGYQNSKNRVVWTTS